MNGGKRPLDGVRVLELGHALAGPFAGAILGYFGAEVVKIEAPGQGDTLRGWRAMDGDTSVWWRSIGRNKRSVTIDLRKEDGRALVRRLAAKHDVVVENFRPGTLEGWGLGPDVLRADNPKLVIARVSGYGQTGPLAQKAGFASVGEAVGGLRYITGVPGEVTVRPNLSLGDSLAGLHAALGVVMALYARERGAQADTVDVALYESVFNMLESTVPEYARFGMVREASGATITGVVPTNAYPCADGRSVVVGANSDSVFKRFMSAVGRGDLASDVRMKDNAGRVVHREELDAAIAAWTSARDSGEVLRALDAADVPAGPIQSVADMFGDAHFVARGLFEKAEAEGREWTLPAMAPRLEKMPGRTDWAGPALGAHTRQVLSEMLGVSDDELDRLEANEVI